MINNVMLVSGRKQNDSVIHIHVSVEVLFPFRLLQNTEQSSLCYTVGLCWLSRSVKFLNWKILRSIQCLNFIKNIRKFQRGFCNKVTQLEIMYYFWTVSRGNFAPAYLCMGYACILPKSGFWNPTANWLLELRNPEFLHRGPQSITHTHTRRSSSADSGSPGTHPEPALEGGFRPEYKKSCLGLGRQRQLL